jgi:tRNA1(Val) A37 N6-methylase TrmN6
MKSKRDIKLGAFYTYSTVATLIADLAIDTPRSKVLDLACGDGALLVSASQRKMELLAAAEIPLENYREFLEDDLTGIDILPSSVCTAIKNLFPLTFSHTPEKMRFASCDSTQLKPELTIQSVCGGEFQIGKVDLVMMNPPFLRQENLTTQQKKTLRQRFNDYEKYLDGKLGLQGYFIFLAYEFAKNDGKIALVLPATTLRLRSTLGLRKFLVQQFAIEHLILSWERTFSQRAEFREIILIASKRRATPELQCCISFLKKMPRTNDEAKTLAQVIKQVHSKPDGYYSNSNLASVSVSQEKIERNVANLYSLVSCYDQSLPGLLNDITQKGSERLLPLHHVLERNKDVRIVRFDYSPNFRGAFAIQPFRAIKKVSRNVDEWLITSTSKTMAVITNRDDGRSLEVPTKAVVGGLRRVWRTDRIDVTNLLDLIVVDSFEGVELVVKQPANLEKLRSYVGSRLGKLTVARKFDLSAEGTRLLSFCSERSFAGVDVWNFHGISIEDAQILSLWVNSSISLLYIIIHRTETLGPWMKIDLATLKQMPTIDPRGLPKQSKEKLLQLYESIKDMSFPSIVEQFRTGFSARKQIDIFFLEQLGFSENEAERILERLYPAILTEIRALRKLMYQSLN